MTASKQGTFSVFLPCYSTRQTDQKIYWSGRETGRGEYHPIAKVSVAGQIFPPAIKIIEGLQKAVWKSIGFPPGMKSLLLF
jgi:hypothetical protein